MNPKQEDLQFKVDEANGPVECLGMTFENDEARRNHFLGILREKLKDPEFRKIEGFPIGSDEDILALSDPPYYTACPNPFIADFIRHYGKPYDPSKPYSREPFAADVSEGKNDPIYNAHSYHTKVPHKAIMRYILHYTEPGDIVFDGFCGTGMTGVAAQMCGDKAVIESLGYRVDKDGTVLQRETNENGKVIWKPFSKLGSRRAVLNDLSPAATFIAYNYNTPVDVKAFEREAKRILKEVEDECGWMYETLHTDGKTKGKINYTVWSDVYVCPECAREVIFWEAAMDKSAGDVKEVFPCPHCKASLTKRNMERAWVSKFDSSLQATVRQVKQVPTLILYKANGKSASKSPGALDLALLDRIENSVIPYWFPTNRMMEGKETRRNDPIGITHVHHFFTNRDIAVISSFLAKACDSKESRILKLVLTSLLVYASKLCRWRPENKSGPLSGTLYISSTTMPLDAMTILANRIRRLVKARISLSDFQEHGSLMTTSSSTSLEMDSNSIDYIFVDPPFGSNLNYSELSFLWESWIKVWTSNVPEAIVNSVQGKGLSEYRQLMTSCFKEAYRVLKPGRWMTVEFSNTKASVWNSIQTALTEAGFIVANVSALDKKQGSFKAVTTPTAVKQDLVISAYKPNGGLEKRFANTAETEEGIWVFLRTHLKNLPVLKQRGGQLEFISERDPRILYDRTVAFYVQRSLPVPLSSAEFQSKLAEKFPERDGMYFLPEQASEYDKKRILIQGLGQMTIWVEDERSAVDWLRNFLKDKPSKYNDVQPEFFEQLNQSWKKWEIKPELRSLLDQNFLCYDGKGDVPPQIHAYLSTNFKELRKLPADDPALRAKAKDRWYVPDPRKNVDVEMMRDKRLLDEFWTYLPPGYHAASAKKGDSGRQQAMPGFEQPQPKLPRGKKLKLVRTEAVRVGFKHCYQNRDYATIIAVAHHIPDDVVNGDDQLQMIYDTAVTRSGGES
jgi:DNA modification methylase